MRSDMVYFRQTGTVLKSRGVHLLADEINAKCHVEDAAGTRAFVLMRTSSSEAAVVRGH
jgi:hypothetical protein